MSYGQVFERDTILAPKVVNISFKLDRLFAQSQSLYLINEVDDLPGVASWVSETAQAMPEALRRDNLLLADTGFFIITGYITTPLPGEDLPQYVERATQGDPIELFDKIESMWVEKLKHKPKLGEALNIGDAHHIFRDRERFVQLMVAIYESPDKSEWWNEAFDMIQQPAQYVARLRQHVHIMWDTYLGEEWARQLPLLNESIQAFQRTDLSDLTLYEAIRVVAGRDMRGRMDDEEAEIDHVIFSPAPHLGPYIAKLIDGNTLRVLYNARLPRGAQAQSSALSRSEVLIRMSALADDTRLRILEMLTKRDEMRAQDIIEALDLSQSSVSRHLSQLSATGFLIERRRDVNKFYSLNVDRVVDTVRALTNFLARQ